MARSQSTYDEHLERLTINERIGMWVTRHVGTMWCAYLFCLLAFVALPEAIRQHSLTVFINWLSSNWLQLVLLPVIIVGQNIQSRHTELQAKADYETNLEAEHRIEELQTLLARIETEKLDEILRLLKAR
jgi:uncharacterized membrane protein